MREFLDAASGGAEEGLGDPFLVRLVCDEALDFSVALADCGRNGGWVYDGAEFESGFFTKEGGIGDSPGAFFADLSGFADRGEVGEGGDFWEGEVLAREVFAVFITGEVSEEDEVIRRWGGEGEGILEVGGEGVDFFRGGPAFFSGGELDFWVEPVEVRAAAAGGLEVLEGDDEVLVEPGLPAAFFIKGSQPFCADGGEGDVELLVPGVPVGLGILLPTAEPFYAVADVGDLVVIDFVEDLGGFLVTCFCEDF